MASASYIRKKRERAKERSKLGVAARRAKMQERGSDLEVAGTITTTGNLGNHFIEILACDDPVHVWLRVDGELRRPRTLRGVVRVLAGWIWRKYK